MHDGGTTVDERPVGPATRGRRAAPEARRAGATGSHGSGTAVESPLADDALQSLWRRSIAIFVLAFALLVAINLDTLDQLLSLWGTSGTFAHGYFIYPVGLWLVWRLRHSLATVVPRAQPLALVPLVLCGAFWLTGHAAGVNAPTQYALVAMTQCLVWAVFGNAVTRRILYPLAFLYFAVPAGDFLMPTLMDHTADFTVKALQLSGVPVYREGNYFQIPSGNWSVVEACSGLRYLIASVTLGFLFAYLNFRSTWRRLAFIGASLLVPIVANWLRAYMIVMIAHLSSNALATGVDHIIYGWLFFGLVMLALFSVGNLWRDDVDDPDEWPDAPPAIALSPADGSRRLRAIGLTTALFVIVAAPWPALGGLIDARADDPSPASVAVTQVDGWTADAPPFTPFAPHYVRSRASFTGTFASGDRRVAVFVGYFSGQHDHGQMLTYDNEVVPVSDRVWGSVASQSRVVGTGDGLRVLENELKGELPGGTQRLVTWRWFWINGRLTNSPVMAKVYTAFEKLIGRGDDSAVIVLMAPAGSAKDHEGQAALEAFAVAAQPRILAALATTHDAARSKAGS